MLSKEQALWLQLGTALGAVSQAQADHFSKLLQGKLDVVDAPAFQESNDGDRQQTLGASADKARTSGFKFGKASLKELEGVKSELVLLARHALALSTQDFCVYDGLRTIKEQEQHVKNGTSQTMNSKHLKGLAIDLVPWIKGKPVWDWDAIYPIACAVDAAARELGIESNIRWGGAWDRTLADFHGDPAAYKRVVEEYGARQRALGKSKVFIDGPHFEWVD